MVAAAAGALPAGVEADLLLGRALVLALAAAATYVALLERLLLLRHERGECLVRVRMRVRVRVRIRVRVRVGLG